MTNAQEINFYIDQLLFSYMRCYRNGFSTQKTLLLLTEKWKKVLNNIRYGMAILIGFLKAFYTINHDLLIVKLHIPRFSESLKLIKGYLIAKSKTQPMHFPCNLC